jgi:hypothetical protein
MRSLVFLTALFVVTFLAAVAHAQDACFCLVRADDPDGPILRDCTAFRAPDDTHDTAICTDADGSVARRLLTDAWRRLAEGDGRCVPCRPESSGERGDGGLVTQAINSLREANIAFNAPASMTVGQSQNITLLLDLDRAIADLLKEISDEGERRGSRIRVSDRMEAHLKGDEFAVSAITPVEQPVVAGGSTQWHWQVTPQKSGRHTLFLTLNAFVEVRGVEKPWTIRTFDYPIEVEVQPLGERAKAFVAENWQWLWTALLLPAGGWIIARLRGGRVAAKVTHEPYARHRRR